MRRDNDIIGKIPSAVQSDNYTDLDIRESAVLYNPQSLKRRDFANTSKAMPCFVCRDTSKQCSRHTEEPLIICRNPRANHKGVAPRMGKKGVPYWVHRVNPAALPPIPAETHVPDVKEDISPVASSFESNLTPELAAELVAHLNLPPGVVDLLAKIGVGFRHGGQKKNRRSRWRTKSGWTFREKDGNGRTIGLHLRFDDGSKRHHDNSARGLCIPDGVLKLAAKFRLLLLVEGASDVLALLAAGIPAIGRPGCKAGVGHLAVFLADLPDEVQVIVVGENDYKPLSGRWPGRDGAHFTAAKLAVLLSRSIHWCVIGSPYRKYTKSFDGKLSYEVIAYKDARDRLVGEAKGETGVRTWAKLGKHLLTDIRADLYRCDPHAIPAPVPAREMKCGRAHRTQLVGKAGGKSAGKGAAIDIKCKCWNDPACKVTQQNKHRATNYATLLRWCAPEHYQPDPDAPRLHAPDLKDVGPWNVGVAVVTDAQRKSLLNSLSRLNKEHSRRVYDYRSIALPEASEESSCWMAICGKVRPKPQTPVQQLLFLVIVATAPIVAAPKVLKRIPLADILAISDAAICETPTDNYVQPDTAEATSDTPKPKQKQRRQNPVTASRNWRPKDRVTRSGEWLRGRSQPIATAHVRRLAKKLGIADPSRGISDTQDSTVHASDPTTLVLFAMMIEKFVQGTDDATFIARLWAWRELLSNAPLGPDVMRALEAGVTRDTLASDRNEIDKAAQSDHDEEPGRAEMREYGEAFKNAVRTQTWAFDILVRELNGLNCVPRYRRTKHLITACRERAVLAMRTHAELFPSVLMEAMLPDMLNFVPRIIKRQRPPAYDYGPRKKCATFVTLEWVMKTIGL